MAIMSMSRFRSGEPAAAAPINLRVCRFERTLLRGGVAEGGVLTCVQPDGRERELHVSMTWDVLAELRAELRRHDVSESDDVIIRYVLRHWGIEEFKRRLAAGACLPDEGLVLDCLGGPCSSQPRRLLEACVLLHADAA
jgi:hypothetical protein